MKQLRSYNAYGIASITSKSVSVLLIGFATDGTMYTVHKNYTVSPELKISAPKGYQLNFACNIFEDKDPEFIFAFTKTPKDPEFVLDDSMIVDFLYDAAEFMAQKLGKTKMELHLPVAH